MQGTNGAVRAMDGAGPRAPRPGTARTQHTGLPAARLGRTRCAGVRRTNGGEATPVAGRSKRASNRASGVSLSCGIAPSNWETPSLMVVFPVPPAQPNPGDRYVVMDYLSEGGMGAIYLGKRLGAGGFERQVVLKQLLPQFTQEEDMIELFLREARLCATLDHANIVQTFDFVAAQDSFFMVMEYVNGADLKSLLHRASVRGQRLALGSAIYIAREVLAALAFAHAKRGFDGRPLGLIHRDVSPSNILISSMGEVKLTDFGIAKAATHQSTFYRVRGKFGYMSPEQSRFEKLDGRSDLYSVAVCLHEMISGQRLFEHEPFDDHEPPPPVPRLAGPGVPAALDTILQKALAERPEDRYRTAGEFAEALARLAHGEGLIWSAATLVDDIVRVAGPASQWREDVMAERLATPLAGATNDRVDAQAVSGAVPDGRGFPWLLIGGVAVGLGLLIAILVGLTGSRI